MFVQFKRATGVKILECIFFLIILLHYHNLSCKAVIAKGECPQVEGNHYDSHQFVNSLNASPPIKLNIYALLPSSPDVESLNIFAYNVNPDIIAGFQVQLNRIFFAAYILCDGYRYMQIFPNLFLDMQIIIHIFK